MVAVEAMFLEVEGLCPRGLQCACPGTRHWKTGIAPAHRAELKTALLAPLDYFERLVAWRGDQAHHDQAALGRCDGRGRGLEEAAAGAGRYKLPGPGALDHHIGRKGLPDQQRGGQRHPKDQGGNKQALHAKGNGGQVIRVSRNILGHGRMATGCEKVVARDETARRGIRMSRFDPRKAAGAIWAKTWSVMGMLGRKRFRASHRRRSTLGPIRWLPRREPTGALGP